MLLKWQNLEVDVVPVAVLAFDPGRVSMEETRRVVGVVRNMAETKVMRDDPFEITESGLAKAPVNDRVKARAEAPVPKLHGQAGAKNVRTRENDEACARNVGQSVSEKSGTAFPICKKDTCRVSERVYGPRT